MKGKIISWQGNRSIGFILGEDGKEYFLHNSEVTGPGAKKIKRGSIVEFYFVDNGEKHPRAICVHKIGHGLAHPFIKDLDRIEEMIETCVDNRHPEKQYRLRDIQMIKNYFAEVEDIEWCPNVREKFRAHLDFTGPIEGASDS